MHFKNPPVSVIEERQRALAVKIEKWLIANAGPDIETDLLLGGPVDDVPAVDFSLVEIWVEAMGRKRSDYTQKYAQRLGRIVALIPGVTPTTKQGRNEKYGKQRIFVWKHQI